VLGRNPSCSSHSMNVVVAVFGDRS
jgi:hypothetical protein